jgi:hypothetical protein
MGTPATSHKPVEQRLQSVPISKPDPRIWTEDRMVAVVGFLLIPIYLLAFSHTVVESVIGVLAQVGLIFWFHRGRHTVDHANREGR